jgi:predicted nucleic acid-binding protein
VVLKERSDAEQGAVLRRWLEEHVLPTFADRVLPFDLSAARILAAYRVPEHAPFDDALIAAVAEAAGMTIATRNSKHLEPLGVSCLNPWDTTPPRA